MDNNSKIVLTKYALDALDILEQCVSLYEQGLVSFYRVAATQLRILVCDTAFRHDRQVDIAIIPILRPDLRLPLFAAKGSTSDMVDLQTWLDSSSGIVEGMTIRQLIRRVCDIDGGAHVDVKPLAGLPQGEEPRQWIIDVSKYLLPILKNALEG